MHQEHLFFSTFIFYLLKPNVQKFKFFFIFYSLFSRWNMGLHRLFHEYETFNDDKSKSYFQCKTTLKKQLLFLSIGVDQVQNYNNFNNAAT